MHRLRLLGGRQEECLETGPRDKVRRSGSLKEGEKVKKLLEGKKLSVDGNSEEILKELKDRKRRREDDKVLGQNESNRADEQNKSSQMKAKSGKGKSTHKSNKQASSQKVPPDDSLQTSLGQFSQLTTRAAKTSPTHRSTDPSQEVLRQPSDVRERRRAFKERKNRQHCEVASKVQWLCLTSTGDLLVTSAYSEAPIVWKTKVETFWKLNSPIVFLFFYHIHHKLTMH